VAAIALFWMGAALGHRRDDAAVTTRPAATGTRSGGDPAQTERPSPRSEQPAVGSETDRLLREWHTELALAEARQAQERADEAELQARVDRAREEESEHVAAPPEHAVDQGFARGEVKVAPPASEFFVVPIRFVLLHSGTYLALTASPDLADEVPGVLQKMNGILAAAGVSLDYQGVGVEEANDASFSAHSSAAFTSRPDYHLTRYAIPAVDLGQPGFRIFFTDDFAGANGVYFGHGDAVVREQAASRRKRGGGYYNQLPRICSHEVGHGLGLPHANGPTRLMAHQGTHLTADEVARVRATARVFPGAWLVGQAAPPPAVAAVAARPLDTPW
jgi:hypothetical protein